MKKLLNFILLFLLLTFTLCSKVFAEDIFKITSATFDTSNSIVVLSAQDGTNSQIMPNVKLVQMENPRRVYFDINSAILTMPKKDWTFTSQSIKQIKISQFNTNPNIVRVVMYLDDDYNISNIKFLRIKNNIILYFKNSICQNNNYFQNTYRDEHSSSSDFYEYLTVTTPSVKNTPPSQNDIAGQIQQAFNSTVEQASQLLNPTEKQELRLNTKYYIDKITPKQNAVLFNGFGSVTLEKPMILTNPSRIVFDLPNTLTSMDIRNKEYKINDTDTVKVGQFVVNKARVVIQTNNVEQYIPIYSSDNQSLLIANKDRIDKNTLYSNTGDMIAYGHKKVDEQTNEMTLSFNHPVVHGLDRESDKLILYLYNISKYNDYTFKNTYANTTFSDATVTLLPNIGMKVTIPLEINTLVSTYIGADGKTIKIVTKASKKTPAKAGVAKGVVSAPVIVPPGKRRIVIDAGHGGTDHGAIRNNTSEKDITLDVSKKVEDMLKKQGYAVLMTRPADSFVSLADRVAMAENFNPDIFVSIHVNSSVRPEITGIETHYYHQESLNLAQTVHSSLASAIDSKNRGLFKSKFYVINHTTSPAILVEIGFISNDNERAQLVSEKRKQATAKAIVEGVNNYFKQLK